MAPHAVFEVRFAGVKMQLGAAPIEVGNVMA